MNLTYRLMLQQPVFFFLKPLQQPVDSASHVPSLDSLSTKYFSNQIIFLSEIFVTGLDKSSCLPTKSVHSSQWDKNKY